MDVTEVPGMLRPLTSLTHVLPSECGIIHADLWTPRHIRARSTHKAIGWGFLRALIVTGDATGGGLHHGPEAACMTGQTGDMPPPSKPFGLHGVKTRAREGQATVGVAQEGRRCKTLRCF